MKKTLFMTAVLLAIAMTAWGQRFEFADVEHHEKEIKVIERKWADKSIQVDGGQQRAGVRDFAKAFCSQYLNYVPNAAMADYLKHPGNYSYEEKHYYVDDAPRNGYIKCDMGWQFDFMTEICYWRRPDGHSLVGVLMQMGHEGEETDHALLFYDYNPRTRVMTPDTRVYKAAKAILAKHRGTACLRMPKEGKNISVTNVEWIGTDDEDFRDENYLLKWTGNSFVEAKDEDADS